MKKLLLVGMAVLWSVAAVANAAEAATTQESGPLADMKTTLDLTYTSKYIWRGFDLLDDASAWQPSANFDFGNGFSANVWASYSGGSGNEEMSRVNATQYNYTLAYSGTYADTCPWKTNYTVGWRYYDFIDNATRDYDLQEAFVEFAMPELIGGGLVPRGAVYQMWDSKGGGENDGSSGTIYAMGVGYGFTLDQAPELPMTFGWDIVYNDGTGGGEDLDIDNDWSHMVWSLKTSFTCPLTGGKITPGVYFQNSFEDTVNNEDELWGMVSYALTF
ncbi:MAG: hypothetical protein L0Y36_01805 [Planctomycetales bacterium]|nr:hypothetical protein [Planctomycetales bacterium]